MGRKEGFFFFSFSVRLVLHSGFYSFEVFAHCFHHRPQSPCWLPKSGEANRVSKTQWRYLYWLLNLLGHGHGLACSPCTRAVFFRYGSYCLLLSARHGTNPFIVGAIKTRRKKAEFPTRFVFSSSHRLGNRGQDEPSALHVGTQGRGEAGGFGCLDGKTNLHPPMNYSHSLTKAT